MSAEGLPSKFEWERPLLLRGGYVRELAAASHPHIHGGSGDVQRAAVVYHGLAHSGDGASENT